MKISELKKIYSDESNPEFKSVSSKVLDALLEVAEAADAYATCTGHSENCESFGLYTPDECTCGLSELELAIARLTDLASGKG